MFKIRHLEKMGEVIIRKEKNASATSQEKSISMCNEADFTIPIMSLIWVILSILSL